MHLPTDFFDTLRMRINVSDVVGKKVSLKKRGHEYSGLCPFHTEKSPSFTVNDVKRFYHCFGCAAHGDVIKFVSETSGFGYKEAAIKLAEDYGIEVPKISRMQEQQYEEISQIHHILRLAEVFFQKNLTSDASKYLVSRGVNSAQTQHYKLGYAPGGNTLRQYLEQNKIPLIMMSKAGLVGKGEDNSAYEIFRDRIIFPIHNIYGKVIGFGGRTMGTANPKYLNSPETVVFKKNDVLYGEDKATSSAYKTGKIIVVEGYMDLIAMQSHGFENTVSTMGTAVTNNHMTRLWNIADEIVICLDGDAAGLRGAKKVIEQALTKVTHEKSVSFMLMLQGFDPDDILVKKGSSYMQNLFNTRLSMAEMIWHLEIKDQTFTTPEQRAHLEQRLATSANAVTDNALKRNYLRFFKEQTWQHFTSKKIKAKASSIPRLPTTMNESEIIEHSILSLLVMHPKLLYNENIREKVGSIIFQNDHLSGMCNWLLEVAFTHDSLETTMLRTLAKSAGFSDIFMLLSSSNFMFFDNKLAINQQETLLWDILIKKHHLVKSKAEYAALMLLASDDAFSKACRYQQEIMKLQQEIDTISDNLTQADKYE
jgi:DNA primase